MTIPTGGAIFLSLELFILFIITGVLLRSFAHKDVSYGVLISVFISWYFGFTGTVLLPLDISEARFGDDLANLYTPWSILYWVTFACCWLILPIIMEIEVAGEFTFLSKCKRALIVNLKFYAILVVIGIIVLIWSAVKQMTLSTSSLISISNAYGLFLVIALMGHGLVDIPHMLWRMSDPLKQLQSLEFHASDIDASLYEAECDLAEIIKQISDIDGQIKNNMSPYRKYVDILLAKCPPLTADTTGRPSERIDIIGQNEKVAMNNLVQLHAKVKAATARVTRNQSQWDNLISKYSELEALMNGGHLPSSSVGSSRLVVLVSTICYFWKTSAGKITLKFLSILAALMSIFILWSEVTISLAAVTSVNLSPFAYMIQADQDDTSITAQFLISLPLFYMSYCLYSSLIKVKLPFAEHYNLYSGQNTDGYALCYNAIYACRMQFSLSYNFLLMLHVPQLYQYTGLFHVLGNMEVALISVLPIFLILFAFMNNFNFCVKMLQKIGIDAARDPDLKNQEHVDQVNEGKHLINRGRRQGLQANYISNKNKFSKILNDKNKPLL